MNRQHWTKRHQQLAATIAGCILGVCALPFASAQPYPAKAVRILVGAPAGAEPSPTAPERFTSVIKSEISKWSQVVKQAHITAE